MPSPQARPARAAAAAARAPRRCQACHAAQAATLRQSRLVVKGPHSYCEKKKKAGSQATSRPVSEAVAAPNSPSSQSIAKSRASRPVAQVATRSTRGLAPKTAKAGITSWLLSAPR